MATQLGEAQVPIRATLDQLDRDLDSARSKITNALQVVGTGALAGLAAAATTIAGLGGALAHLAIDAAPLETIRQGFEGIAESAGSSMDEMIAALEEGSAGMVSQRDLMMTFNQAAQLVSTDFASRLPDAMESLRKVSAATGRDMGFLLDSLVTGVGRLSPMILDNLAIQVNLTEAYDTYAASLGKSADELTKTEQQTALMNQVLELLARNTENIPDVMGTAQQGLASFQATIQNTKDQLGLALQPALQNVMGIIGQLVDRVLPPLVAFFENRVAPIIEQISRVLLIMFGNMQNGESASLALKRALFAVFGEAAEPIVNVIDVIGRLQYALSSLFTGENKVYEDMGQWEATIVRIGAAIHDVLAPIVNWIGDNVKLQDVLLGLGIAIGTVVVPIIASLVSSLAPIIAIFAGVVLAITLLRKAWETDFMGIRSTLTDLWEGTIKPVFDQVREVFEEVWPTLMANVKELWAELAPAFEGTGGFIRDVLIPLIGDGLALAIEGLGQGLIILVKFIANDLIPAFTSIVRWVKDELIPWFNQSRENVGSWGQQAGAIVRGFRDTFFEVKYRILDAIRELINWFDKLLSPLRAVWDFIKKNIFPIFDALANVYMAVVNLAARVLAGLWQNVLLPALMAVGNWIKSNVMPILQRLADFIRNTVNKAIEAWITIWKDRLRPALQSVRDFIRDQVIGTLASLRDEVSNRLGPAIEWLKSHIIDPLKNSFSSVSDAIKGVIDWLNDLANKINSISLPDWLEPGSPTPFEMGLRGIASALRDLSTIELPAFSAGLELVPGLGGGFEPGGAEVHNHWNLTIHSAAQREDVVADYNMMKVLAGA